MVDADDREMPVTERETAGQETEKNRVGRRDGCRAGLDEGAAKSEGRQWECSGQRLGGDSHR